MKVFTTCTRDCPGTCGLNVHTVKGRVKSITGSRLHPYSRGFSCSKASLYHRRRLYSGSRILDPLIKSEDGTWKRISWDTALDILSEKLLECVDEYGSESIVYYQGFGARTALRLINRRFFNLLGGVTTLRGTLCGGTGQAGQELDFGVRISHDPHDHLNSRCIFLWGRNPAVTDGNLWKIIRRAVRQGSTLVTVDPIRTLTAKRSDIHCQIRPGTDQYLALALSKIIIEEGLHDTEFIKRHVDNFEAYLELIEGFSLQRLSSITDVRESMMMELAGLCSDGPASMITGWGLQRYRDSHMALRFIDALAAVSGNIGISGGGVSSGFDEYGAFDMGVTLEKETRKISMPLFGRELDTLDSPPVRVVFITAGNPVTLGPDSMRTLEALRRVPFVVMVDHFLNDTSYASDLFLPATTFLEETDLAGSYGHSYVSPVNRAVKPLGNSRSEFWIFQKLSITMGIQGMDGSEKEWLELIASDLLDYYGIEIDELLRKPYRNPVPEVPFSNMEFPTPTGRFRLPEEITPEGPETSMRLLTVMPPEFIGSGEPESMEGLLRIYMNPSTISEMGFEDGEVAVVESKTGTICAILKPCDDVRRDCAFTYRGGWLSKGNCINAVIEEMESYPGHGTPYNETAVGFRKIRGSGGSDHSAP